MIIMIGASERGIGTSTIAVNLCVMIERSGEKVLLVDADSHGFASSWAQARNDAGMTPIIPCVQKTGKNLRQELIHLSKEHSRIIVDVGGGNAAELRAAVTLADQWIIPIRPAQFDPFTLRKMNELAAQAKTLNSSIQVSVVITCVPIISQTPDRAEAKELIAEFANLSLMDTIMRERVAFRLAVRVGLAVDEIPPPDKEAIEEMKSFCREVSRCREKEQSRKSSRKARGGSIDNVTSPKKKPEKKQQPNLPWEKPGASKVTFGLGVPLSEGHMAKLHWIKSKTDVSLRTFCRKRLEAAIDEEIRRLIDKEKRRNKRISQDSN